MSDAAAVTVGVIPSSERSATYKDSRNPCNGNSLLRVSVILSHAYYSLHLTNAFGVPIKGGDYDPPFIYPLSQNQKVGKFCKKRQFEKIGKKGLTMCTH